MLLAAIDGAMRCRACGRNARLDLFGRWVVSIILAITLPGLLLYGQVFYSGHLFVVSLVVILAGWRFLTWLGLPFFGLEPATTHVALRPKQSAFVATALLIGAIVMDTFMYSRFEPAQAIEQAGAPEAVPRDETHDPLRIRPRDERDAKAAKFSL